MTESCDHDWRVNPFIRLASYPPQNQHVCAKCGAKKASGLDHSRIGVRSTDPKDWPRV